MRFLKVTLAYDGTDFFGWQVQDQQRSVQQVLETAIQKVTGESLRVTAAGRTDAGVHALGQVAGFSTAAEIAPDAFCRALNANLPDDVLVLSVAEAPQGFHATRDAIRKRYRYMIQDDKPADLFNRRYAWQLRHRLDEQLMADAALALVGRHDFASFQGAGSPRKGTVRNVSELSVRRGSALSIPGPVSGQGSDVIVIEIEADGFLYNMVRNIVGTLEAVGAKKQPPAWTADVLAATDRRVAGATAPPHGLFLVSVEYDGM
jgi:tRNA pseudouridine38-40 synthase